MSTHDDSRPNHSVPITILAVLAWIGAYCIAMSASAQDAAAPEPTDQVCSYQQQLFDAAVTELEQEIQNMESHCAAGRTEGEAFVTMLQARIEHWRNPPVEQTAPLEHLGSCSTDFETTKMFAHRKAVQAWVLERTIKEAEEHFPEGVVYNGLIDHWKDILRLKREAVIESMLVAYPTELVPRD